MEENKVEVMASEQVRKSWRDVLDMVEKGTHVVVTRYNKPVVVVVDYEFWLRYRSKRESPVAGGSND